MNSKTFLRTIFAFLTHPNTQKMLQRAICMHRTTKKSFVKIGAPLGQKCLVHSLLSPPTHVLTFPPHFKDSVEWSKIPVGWFRPNWWLFLEDKVKARKSEKCSNVFVSDRQLTSRKFIIHLWFATKIYKQENFLSF